MKSMKEFIEVALNSIQDSKLKEEASEFIEELSWGIKDHVNRENIYHVWSIADMHDAIDNAGKEPVSDEIAYQLLLEVDNNCDSEYGITWDSLQSAIDTYYDSLTTVSE